MRKLFVIVLLVSGFAAQAGSAAAQVDGFGFYPSRLQVEDGLRGQRYDAGTVIVNQTDQQRLFHLSAEGDIGAWISFATREDTATKMTDVTVEPGSELELAVLIDIPADTANGDYAGSVLMENRPLPDQTFNLIPALRQSIQLSVTGTQQLELRLGESLAKDVEVGRPLRIQTQVTNSGNVNVEPDVSVVVHGNAGGQQGPEVATFTATAAEVMAGKTETVETLWETLGQALGEYKATVSFSVQGKDFGTREVPFNIVPVGSLTRAGAIQSIALATEPAVGEVARVDVAFLNQGQTDALATFAGQLYLDGAAVAETKSQAETLARPGVEATMSTFFPITEEGSYELRGRVFYDGAQTEEAVLAFTVGDAGGGDRNRAIILGLGGMAVLGGIAVAGTGVYRRRRSQSLVGAK
jgi:hypothetical protein